MSRTHGEPTRHESIGAEEHYFWEKGGLTLHLVVDRGLSKLGDEQILMIEVEGEKSNWMAQTGAGLRLGDDINRVSKIYGKKFHLRNIPELDIYDVQIQWKKDESATLLAEFDSLGKIRKLSLLAPE